MTTIREIADRVNKRLHSFTGLQEQYTYLTAPASSSDTTLQVAHTGRLLEGLIEVDDELVLVDQVQDLTVSLFPFGRGQNGTLAASHSVNARVVSDPLVPRQDILEAIQETIATLHPTLFQVKETEFLWQTPTLNYELPTDVDRVLAVTYDTPGPYKIWPAANSWNVNLHANATDFASGKSIEIRERITPGLTVQVTYAGPFGAVTGFTQTLEDLGIPESVADVILYGACWRLVSMMETSRLQMESVEQFARQQAVQPGQITNYARQLFAMFQQRLNEERARLLTLHPRPIHFTR